MAVFDTKITLKNGKVVIADKAMATHLVNAGRATFGGTKVEEKPKRRTRKKAD